MEKHRPTAIVARPEFRYAAAALRALGLALGANALTSVITWLLLRYQVTINAVFLFLLAIIACAFFGGFLAGWLATAIFSFAVPYLFVRDFDPLQMDYSRPVILLIVSTTVSWVRARQLRAEDALRRANQELEGRVEERTTRLRAEIAERERTQQQLAAIVEFSEDAIVSTDLEGIILTWNSGAERLYGYTAQEMIGSIGSPLLASDGAAELAAAVERLKSGERVQHFDTIRIRKNSTPIDVNLTLSPIRDGAGQLVGISQVARDITQQKQLEEKMRHTQKLESVGVLSGGISHDFNNLLVGMLGNASLVLETLPPDDPNRELLEDVVSAAQRASDLTRQLLAYAGRARITTRQMDLSVLVREISGLLGASVPKKVELRLELGDRLPPVEADAAQIQQIVMNLIINAAEAIDHNQGGVIGVCTGVATLQESDLRANLAPGEVPPGPYVYFQVRDTGCGMDEPTRERIFDPFFTTKFTGRGLGLSAVLGIVRGHRGALTLNSAPGRGSTFTIYLPASAPAGPVSQEARPAAVRRGSGTVFVIDDEPLVRQMARATLESTGYRVLLAENGLSGLELFVQKHAEISLVLLDLAMPVLDGAETLARMRSIDSNVPVVLSSGFDEAEARQRFDGMALAGFLQKPYTAAALANKVHSVLNGVGAGAR